MNTQIRIVVERNGKVRLEVEGVAGTECLSVTAPLEKEMGEVCVRRRTEDFYKSRHIVLRNRITSGDAAA